MYLTNILHVSMCVYCNRSQMTSQPVKNQKVRHRPKSSEWLLFVTSCDIFCDLLQYTHTENVNYLFYTIKIQMVYLRILGMKNKGLLTWSDVNLTPYVCPAYMHINENA